MKSPRNVGQVLLGLQTEQNRRLGKMAHLKMSDVMREAEGPRGCGYAGSSTGNLAGSSRWIFTLVLQMAHTFTRQAHPGAN